MNQPADCPSCGAQGIGGLAGCDETFSQLIGEEFSNALLFRAHRLTVDAYCLQHPEKYMISSKSATAHLAGICWSLEIEESVHMPPALKQLVDGPQQFERIAVPAPQQRGAVNILHLTELTDPQDYLRAAREWAQSAWTAWPHAWEQTRAWIARARRTE